MALTFDHHDTDKSALELIRKESLDIYNRLHSIAEDVRFVEEVHGVYPELPMLSNLRCGAWYTDLAIAKDVPAYFKSTDGHFHNWSFNLRRSNLHLVPLIEEWKGVIFVDSTRSGKRIPDALSKTIPIWCAVINRAIALRFPRPPGMHWDTALYTPPGAVSTQEHHRIEQHLGPWADDLFRSSFEVPNLSSPLRPFWITPATTRFPAVPKPSSETREFLPVICLSASKRVDLGAERRTTGFSYIQGSGDDHELWGMGLTPEIFWEHKDTLLSADRSQLPGLIEGLILASNCSGGTKKTDPDPIDKIQGRLLLCALSDLTGSQPLDAKRSYILITPEDVGVTPTSDAINDTTTTSKDDNVFWLHLDSGKRGQHDFLKRILPLATNKIRGWLRFGRDVCIACENGKDASVGVALAAMQMFFDDGGCYSDGRSSGTPQTVDKAPIRKRLEWIIASRPTANPSRTTLKRVNEFLLTPSVLRC